MFTDPSLRAFLIRRVLRIFPLAWLALGLGFLWRFDATEAWRSFSFTNNLPPFALPSFGGHFWSLSVEVQFYFGITAMMLIFRQRTFMLLPLLAVLLTFYRSTQDELMSIATIYRIDEILAGCTLALIHHGGSRRLKAAIARLNPYVLFAFFLASCHLEAGFLNYLRPYLAMLLVGSTLFKSRDTRLFRWLTTRPMLYIAEISYALYVIHGIMMTTWLGTGGLTEKYLKRPLLLLVTFALAHVSTRYFEQHFITLGKRLTARLERPDQSYSPPPHSDAHSDRQV